MSRKSGGIFVCDTKSIFSWILLKVCNLIFQDHSGFQKKKKKKNSLPQDAKSCCGMFCLKPNLLHKLLMWSFATCRICGVHEKSSKPNEIPSLLSSCLIKFLRSSFGQFSGRPDAWKNQITNFFHHPLKKYASDNIQKIITWFCLHQSWFQYLHCSHYNILCKVWIVQRKMSLKKELLKKKTYVFSSIFILFWKREPKKVFKNEIPILTANPKKRRASQQRLALTPVTSKYRILYGTPNSSKEKTPGLSNSSTRSANPLTPLGPRQRWFLFRASLASFPNSVSWFAQRSLKTETSASEKIKESDLWKKMIFNVWGKAPLSMVSFRILWAPFGFSICFLRYMKTRKNIH